MRLQQVRMTLVAGVVATFLASASPAQAQFYMPPLDLSFLESINNLVIPEANTQPEAELTITYTSDLSDSFVTNMEKAILEAWEALDDDMQDRIGTVLFAMERLAPQGVPPGTIAWTDNGTTQDVIIVIYEIGHNGLKTAEERVDMMIHELGHAISLAVERETGKLAGQDPEFYKLADDDGLIAAFAKAVHPEEEAFAEAFLRAVRNDGRTNITGYGEGEVESTKTTAWVHKNYVELLADAGLAADYLLDLNLDLDALISAAMSSIDFDALNSVTFYFPLLGSSSGGGTPVITITEL